MCVKLYKIEVKGPEQRAETEKKLLNTVTEDTYTTFEELDPCGEYNFSIIPQSKNGSLGEIYSERFETLEGSEYK